MGIVTRSFTSYLANTDGTINFHFPLGDKGAGETAQWNLGQMSPVSNIQIGHPIVRQVRQFLTSSSPAVAAAATITIVQATGDNPVTEGWVAPGSGNNLTNLATQTGSGTFKLQADHASLTTPAVSGVITWSIIPAVVVDWDYVATADGLDNGTGEHNWVAFPDYTLNVNPAGDGYLQVTASATHGFGGISTDWPNPAFVAGVSYQVSITIAAGTNWTAAVLAINDGPRVTVPLTAGVHNLTAVAGSGNNSLVIHGNNGATSGQVLRLASITADAIENVFNFAQPTYVGNEIDTSIAYGVTRTIPTNSAATINVAITTGGSLATNNNATLSWAANEGGTKTGSINPSADGTVVLTISSPSIGVLGSQTTTSITINPEASGATYPRIGTLLLHDTFFGANAYETPGMIAKMALRHVVIIGGWPELQAARGGTSNQSIIQQIKSASGVGTRVFMYVDPEGVHKDNVGAVWVTHRAKMLAQNWYLYAVGASGARLDSYYDASKHAVNLTSVVQADGNGFKPPQWFASHMASWAHNGGESNAAAPSLDGLFVDNILHTVRRSGDWNRNFDTGDDGGEDTNTAYRQALAALIDAYKAANPTRQVIGNVPEWMNVDSIQASVPEYYQKLHGGLIEHAITTASWSPDQWQTPAQLVAHLQESEDNALDPSLMLVGSYPTSGVAHNSTQGLQEFRYALAATTVLTNMNLYWSRDALHRADLDYYPEYGFNLGAATTSRQSSPISGNTAYRRDFANGIVIWWPKNSNQAVTLGGTFYALQGSGAAWLSPGQAVTSVTPPSVRNGIVLSRTPT